MIFLEIKYDHQGFTVVIGCEFCTLWGLGRRGERVCMITEGKYVPLDYIQTVCTHMLPYKKMLLPVATSFALSVPQLRTRRLKKMTNVLAHAQYYNLICSRWPRNRSYVNVTLNTKETLIVKPSL